MLLTGTVPCIGHQFCLICICSINGNRFLIFFLLKWLAGCMSLFTSQRSMLDNFDIFLSKECCSCAFLLKRNLNHWLQDLAWWIELHTLCQTCFLYCHWLITDDRFWTSLWAGWTFASFGHQTVQSVPIGLCDLEGTVIVNLLCFSGNPGLYNPLKWQELMFEGSNRVKGSVPWTGNMLSANWTSSDANGFSNELSPRNP